jgi:putative FmdB family regulatory protein
MCSQWRTANNGEPLANSEKRGTTFGKNFSKKPNHYLEQAMPLYEYICRNCNNKFGEVLTIKEHETRKVSCPRCQSTDLEKVIEPFFAKTVGKTRGY